MLADFPRAAGSRVPTATAGLGVFASVLALLAALTLPAAPAAAQTAAQLVKPWVPPAGDSLAAWAAQARVGFREVKGDSATGSNYTPYEQAGIAARFLLRSLGPERLTQAHLIKPALDSLGLETEVAIDPLQPNFALVMVRNPFRFSSQAVGFLYWYRGPDLRMQGAVYLGGMEPRMRVWWTGKQDRPWECGVIEHARGEGALHFTLLRLDPSGGWWHIVQDAVESPVLNEPGEAQFADLNHDGIPELMSWTRPPTDSLVVPCSDCPRMITQRTLVERPLGYQVMDTRILSTPYSTFVLFIRALVSNNRAGASVLVSTPEQVTRAIAAGWGARRKAGTWRIEYAEPGEAWPGWFEVRFDGPQGVKRYVVHFTERDGRWVIADWIEPKPVKPGAGAVAK
jgi:hypothetical protein